ncbi:hypothetical protein [Chryseobacterium sp. POE27]|uniref:hypothetical protein n=1 Tax=Chryseobacterium sp. POE27 TaxID=3138177 RepID=UPI00321ACD26
MNVSKGVIQRVGTLTESVWTGPERVGRGWKRQICSFEGHEWDAHANGAIQKYK